ncbi:MAG: phosphoribosylformylglycinamidine synthase [Candidatus Schekmanbacteria bacterium RIFCSPHIGHO2_02_FULL_38_11]|uniref:Phosphoribosylformylglycinamidine synthase subunit PurS n=1 Tax=Candidatus Schekmanbacteria bacterium RIFCSPLOWO2_12_FULL_38_15 TaxID=1817883 RepID=A0A1F7SIA8_9BACT|nr:MAG: phosphoribosylformylglycinamidine synthase [Candidatus Schekmanbacteria bacterium GWA2_38_9]OGL50741.1 MAG: phosphoribosylformylglycinamidine synthase [Candidatus Schekmanbacteria bacterium RIFCSPLOWO2_02_FULL_38_14]OGL53499.1 MAG: phosphoribosylformylglycinamidine synthase [Candidatus Schekmanbacteria bacterium RIFCSPLOWO2_12_FULL_38_15]OGL54454.1 MAG: phosphoribosylformylglycinamidine synthase [Candidatus Schekmanbacteria bacterium RIFCSPHIGHO2_02_FULL_38_11]
MSQARVYVTLKPSVLDPQGKAVKSALVSLGFQGLKDIRVGKYFEINIDEISKETAIEKIKEMCEKLLANTVIENYRLEIVE